MVGLSSQNLSSSLTKQQYSSTAVRQSQQMSSVNGDGLSNPNPTTYLTPSHFVH